MWVEAEVAAGGGDVEPMCCRESAGNEAGDGRLAVVDAQGEEGGFGEAACGEEDWRWNTA